MRSMPVGNLEILPRCLKPLKRDAVKMLFPHLDQISFLIKFYLSIFLQLYSSRGLLRLVDDIVDREIHLFTLCLHFLQSFTYPFFLVTLILNGCIS